MYNSEANILAYRAQLQAAIRNDETINKANADYLAQAQLGVRPVPPQFRSVAEERRDVIKQRQIALENFKTVMDGNEASAVVNGLRDTDLWIINSNWNTIVKELNGRKNIDRLFMNSFLTRLNQKLSATDGTMVDILAQEGTLRKIGELLQESRAAQSLTSSQINDLKQALLMNLSGGETDSELSKLMEEYAARVASGQVSKEETGIPDFIEMTKKSKRRSLDISNALKSEGKAALSESEIASESVKSASDLLRENATVSQIKLQFQRQGLVTPEELRLLPNRKGALLELFASKRGEEWPPQEIRTKKRMPSIDELMAMEENDLETAMITNYNIDVAVAKQALLNALKTASIPTMESLRREYIELLSTLDELKFAKAFSRSAKDDAIFEKNYDLLEAKFKTIDFALSNAIAETGESKGGRGFSKLRTRKSLVGRGVSPPEEQIRYREFGKWIIHLPSLKQGILNVKYPSMASIKSMPQQIISQDLVDFVLDVLEGNMNERLYTKLAEADRKVFNRLARLSGVDSKLGVTDNSLNEVRAMMDRFQLVRGEVLAGNNNPDVLRELKHLTLRLVTGGKISKGAAHDLLIELAFLE